MTALSAVVERSEVILCVGAGGVGKTTTAAALALEGARRGRAAVVVTIDPARRLADALGIDALGNEPTPVQLAEPMAATLHALMLDTKSTFDALVGRYASDDEQVERILANRFYRNISHALSGTQEYMAAEKLFELHESSTFDLVVVDTPPTRQALDFLDAPNQLARLLDHKVYRLLTAPGRGMTKVVNRAAQSVLRAGGRLVGAGVLEDAVAFFAAFEGMEQGFRDRSRRVGDLLASDATAFVLVASPRVDTVAEAAFFADRLGAAQLPIAAVVANRVTPRFAPQDPLPASASHGGYARLVQNLVELADLALAESSSLEALADRAGAVPVVTVPLLGHDIHDLGGLSELGRHLMGNHEQVVPRRPR